MTRVLFVCVKNGGKSPMAAGLFQQLVDRQPIPGIEISSAGTNAASTANGQSVEVLAEDGVDIARHQPRQLTPAMQTEADWVITVGAEAAVEQLPGPRYETWIIDEPSTRGIDGIERMRLVRDDIGRHVRDLHARLTATR